MKIKKKKSSRTSLDSLLEFSSFLDAFRKVERVVFVNGTDRRENDVDHSYMLAMLGWYVCSVEKLKLDLDKVIRYALVHDLVEVYAGDTYFYTKDAERAASKETREKAAKERIAAEFADFADLPALIEKYEKKEDAEARFVYALDKIQPMIMIYLDHGRSWKKDGITYAMAREKKDSKVALDPTVKKYWEEFIVLLEENRHYFAV